MFPKNPDKYCAFCDPKVIDRQLIFEDLGMMILANHLSDLNRLVVAPRRHVATLTELGLDEAQDLMSMIYKATFVLDTLSPKEQNINFGWNQGELAGQKVPHLHVHIVTRTPYDRFAMSLNSNLFDQEADKKNVMNPDKLDRRVRQLRKDFKDII